jgi:hypothetical protein
MNSVDRTVVALVLVRFNAQGRGGTSWPTATLLHDSTPSRPLAHGKSTKRDHLAIGFVRPVSRRLRSSTRFCGSALGFVSQKTSVVRSHFQDASSDETFANLASFRRDLHGSRGQSKLGSFCAFSASAPAMVGFVWRVFATNRGDGWVRSARFRMSIQKPLGSFGVAHEFDPVRDVSVSPISQVPSRRARLTITHSGKGSSCVSRRPTALCASPVSLGNKLTSRVRSLFSNRTAPCHLVYSTPLARDCPAASFLDGGFILRNRML